MAQDAECVPERAAMVEIIRAYARSDASLLGPQGISESVLEAVGQTERHRFIPGRSCSVAYMDGPVAIGQGQTISQPFIVALMTHLASVKSDHTVLEVGTGSGYQAAILARLVRKVCTIEIIPPLAESAAKVLRELGYDNVNVKVGDGYHGWPECGPFDATIVTAALGHVPLPLIEQLKKWVAGWSCRWGLSMRHSSSALANAQAFAAYLAPLRNSKWVIYCKRPFGGPEEVLRYLARYTHRVAISNRRLVSLDDNRVTFKWKDYRLQGPERYNKLMTLDTHEFIRRFLMHVLPAGFHRIRYYGFLTSQTRARNIARIRELLTLPLIPVDAIKAANAKPEEPKTPEHPCPCCGSRMRIIETFLRGQQPKHRATPLAPKIGIDTS